MLSMHVHLSDIFIRIKKGNAVLTRPTLQLDMLDLPAELVTWATGCLEVAVEERSLIEEKKKADILLGRMLPR
ncbi:unnamed protein product [Strongylus vulgaris]|uniref:Uncharacterized protein n=1 Tax=Strongylus vulgaris TaxID=40348 RepID=A0A3P7IBA1_STRVU|nr:unnamed protein product [Strongylus vulgaris]